MKNETMKTETERQSGNMKAESGNENKAARDLTQKQL
jgi:hypothetical protein